MNHLAINHLAINQALAAGSADPVQTALALRAQGRLQEALEALSAPGDFPADFYILRGDLQMEMGQVKEAAGSYFTVTASDPGNVYAHCNLGLCLLRLERWEGAAEALEAVLRFDPHRDEIRLDLGLCLIQLKRFEEALVCFDKCWSDGARKRALFGKAVALQLLRRFDEAEANYERVLTLDRKAEEALSNMLAMSMEVFDLARVERFSERLLQVNPRAVAALKGLALIAIERRDYETAAGFFFRAAEEEPSLAEPAAAKSDAVEYRISRKVYDALVAAKNQRPKTARAFGGA